MNEKVDLGLTALGESKQAYKFDEPTIDILEKFEAPTWGDLKDNPAGAQQVSIKVPEFTSLCPITGQPDFAHMIIEYCAKQWCVESKSLKLYMFAFRNHGSFHEACVNKIMEDIVKLLDPWWIQVQGQFTPRGGIPFWPTQRWENPLLSPRGSGAGIVVPPGARRQ